MRHIIFFFIVIFFFILIQSILSSIRSLLATDQSVTNLTHQVQTAQQEHTFLKQQLTYVQTNQYIEEEARNKLGMVKPGEHIVIAPLPASPHVITIQGNISNWEKWLKLFMD